MTQAYYRKTPQQALEAQNASAEGLSAQEARRRAEQYGPNKLSEGKKKSTLQVFLEQFKDLMVLILIIAAVISAFSGNVESTIVIFAVLVLNAILGTVQYEKAEKSLESLKAMASPTAKVMRGGVRVEIPSADVVPGDIVLLEAGDMVVADGRVLENFSLKVNESSLTGESEGVDKTAEAIDADQVALGDQKNMVFSGSLVTYGRATVLVTGTGMDTELGKIAALMNQTQQRKTPLQQSLDSFSAKLAMVIMAICAVVFALSIFRTGMGILDSLMFAVALAVAAIPEALSSIVTIVLAMGTQKMARQNAIMKDLKAVESLGSVSVICSDKTGTLTRGVPEVTAVRSLSPGVTEEQVYAWLARAELGSEHPLGKAVVRGWQAAGGGTPAPAEDFEALPGRGLRAVLDGHTVLAGSEALLEEAGAALPPAARAEAEGFLARGCTLIYLAVDGAPAGFCALADTVRGEAAAMLRALSAEGVSPVLLTGDNENAAAHIARTLSIREYRAGCLPEDKLNWIDRAQQAGVRICMVGDGINDAPALKRAFVGIAMGGVGSDIAVDAADIVLVNDRVEELPHLLALSRRMMTTIRLNLAFSMALNLVAIVLAMTGVLNPVVGALVHNAGSVLVILNSALLLKWRRRS